MACDATGDSPEEEMMNDLNGPLPAAEVMPLPGTAPAPGVAPEPVPVEPEPAPEEPVHSLPVDPVEPMEPMGCIPNPSGTQVDQGDGTFLDEVTCLMWTAETHPKGTAASGKDHVASCSSSAVGGYDDWRGPDAAEMVSLIVKDESCGNWNQDGNFLPIVDSKSLTGEKIFWTTTPGDSEIKACAVNGNNSTLKGGARDNPWHVLCVRGESTITGSISSCSGDPCNL